MTNCEMAVEHKEIDASDLTDTRVVILKIKDMPVIIGFVTWDDEEKTLEMIRVENRFRRKGYGTYLVQLADQYAGCTLRDNGYRSPEGTALLTKMKRQLARKIETVKSESCGAMMLNLLTHKLMERGA